MRHIIWRNRASAILGLLVMLIPLTGFPEAIRDSLVILLGFFIVIFGFSRNSVGNYSYAKKESSSDRDDEKIGREIEDHKNISAEGAREQMVSKKKYHRKNPIKPNYEKPEPEAETKTQPTELSF